jgi:predicted metalloendopeptidase
MPDRDYYLKPDAQFADARARYRGYIETMLRLGGTSSAGEATSSHSGHASRGG